MRDLARGQQSKQGPCRLRGGGGGILVSPVVEPGTGGIFAPTTVLVLDRQQPVRGLAHHRVLVIDAGGIERAQGRPGAVNEVHPPAAIPRAFRKLGPAQVSDPGRDRLAEGSWYGRWRSEEHTSELQSPDHLVCRLLLEKKKPDRRSTRLNSTHQIISSAVFCVKKKSPSRRNRPSSSLTRRSRCRFHFHPS